MNMPSKYQVIVAMAASEAQSIVSSSEKYMAFLTTAANTYKYSFQDQLLIHAQKPGAIACADIDTWNRFGRWVNRGTKGIALLVDTTSAYRLRYVFNLADTNSRVNKFIPIWQMQERYEEAAKESLGNSYGEEFLTFDLPQALIESSRQAVADNLADYLRDLQLVTMGSFLEELDQLNLEVWLRSTVENSIACRSTCNTILCGTTACFTSMPGHLPLVKPLLPSNWHQKAPATDPKQDLPVSTISRN